MKAGRDDTPSIREIGELTARLRRLSAAGRNADPVERASFLAEKDALLARIEESTRSAGARAVDERRADADGWFAGGYDAAHSAHLADLGGVDVDASEGAPPTAGLGYAVPPDVDGRTLPPWPAGTMPAEMLDGIEERRTAPARPDDPAEFRARIDALREQICRRDADDARAVETGEWARDEAVEADDDGCSR